MIQGFDYMNGVPTDSQQQPPGINPMGAPQQQLLQSAYAQSPMIQGLQGQQGGYGQGIAGITGGISGLSNLPQWAQQYTSSFGAHGASGFGSGDQADRSNTALYQGIQNKYGADFTPWAYSHGYDPGSFDFLHQQAYVPGQVGGHNATGVDLNSAWNADKDGFNIWAGQKIGDKNTNRLYDYGGAALSGEGSNLFQEYLGNKWGYNVDPITGARIL